MSSYRHDPFKATKIRRWKKSSLNSEAVTRSCSFRKVFLKISQNSQENTCAESLFLYQKRNTVAQVFSCEFCKIFKNTFFYRTRLVKFPAASVNTPAKRRVKGLSSKEKGHIEPTNTISARQAREKLFYVILHHQAIVIFHRTSKKVLTLHNIG